MPPMIDTSTLPTPIARVAARLNATGPDGSGDTFLMTSYLAEAAIKTLAIALHAAVKHGSPDHAYRHAFNLVRADGLGVWESAIRDLTSHPVAGYLPPEFSSILLWATKKRTKPEDEWYREARRAVEAVLAELGEDPPADGRSARDLIRSLVQIRNKTKAHGAVGPDFFAAANHPYVEAVRALILSCPLFSWKWSHLVPGERGKVRGKHLQGESPLGMTEAEALSHPVQVRGVHFCPDQGPRLFSCAELLPSNLECTRFMFPNGGATQAGIAEFLDYSSGQTTSESIAAFISPPAPLPPSETHGLDELQIQSNSFGNLPASPEGYVQRPTLQKELTRLLLDRNHHIVTLHGYGGVGKTSLALFVAHELMSKREPHFEAIVWFSARDVDLRPTGPTQVRQAVVDLKTVAKLYGRLFGTEPNEAAFASVLQGPQGGAANGTLFVFDNFETMSSLTELHKFLDTHAHLPNKVLITSRERSFKADYPIEVRGMEFEEAREMLVRGARALAVEGLLTSSVIEGIYTQAGGHAYMMRVCLGELARERRYVPPKQLIPRAQEAINAIFERSFNKLTPSGRWVFLVVSNWTSELSELALIAVLSPRDVDVLAGIEECRRLALIDGNELADGSPCYSSPQLARVFGYKKLTGDPDRLAIEEAIQTLRTFGVVSKGAKERVGQETLVGNFVRWVESEQGKLDATGLARLDALFESVATLWPQAWIELARFRRHCRADWEKTEHAYRRACEEAPTRGTWEERAEYADFVGDRSTMITSLVSAVELDPTDVNLLREVSFQLCNYVNEHKADIPRARRGTYLASVRTFMTRVADKLDATGLSRLAWLFLLEDNRVEGEKYARLGLEREPDNRHCAQIIERLTRSRLPPQ